MTTYNQQNTNHSSQITNHRKKILLTFGTRPEAIKMAPLVKKLQALPNEFETKVCVSGQHREMLDQVLDIFDIVPDFDLKVMKQGQDLYDVTSKVLLGMREIFKEYQPDILLVHGDTSTSTAAALAAFYQQIPVGHIEAGLRTHNIYSPWPEEMNRQLTGRLTSHHFAPTIKAKENLLLENIAESSIYVTGNTVIDALFLIIDKFNIDKELAQTILSKLTTENKLDPKIIQEPFILVTGHRRENFGEGFIQICQALAEIAEKHPNYSIIYPVHLNPNVQTPVNELLGKKKNIFLIQPLEYLSFIYLMKHCQFIITDSGGIQEEAPGIGKPVLVMRDTTERPEAVEAGTVKLVGTNKDVIVQESSKLIEDAAYYKLMSGAHNPYGDGTACDKIISELQKISIS